MFTQRKYLTKQLTIWGIFLINILTVTRDASLLTIIWSFRQCWSTPLIPAWGGRGRGSSESKASLVYRACSSQGYTGKPCLETPAPPPVLYPTITISPLHCIPSPACSDSCPTFLQVWQFPTQHASASLWMCLSP